jgi:hypothetical protein
MHEQSVYVVATLCSMVFGLLACGFITAYVYTPELYPTSIRALGCGLGSAWLKVGAIIAPVVVSKALIGGELALVFYIFAAMSLMTAAAIARFGIETRDRVLEQLDV